MTSGAIELLVDGVACSTEINGVTGGVFDCGGLIGTNFTMRCTTTCSPYLSVVELRLFKLQAATLFGESYDFPGMANCSEGVSENDQLFNRGSTMYIS